MNEDWYIKLCPFFNEGHQGWEFRPAVPDELWGGVDKACVVGHSGPCEKSGYRLYTFKDLTAAHRTGLRNLGAISKKTGTLPPEPTDLRLLKEQRRLAGLSALNG